MHMQHAYSNVTQPQAVDESTLAVFFRYAVAPMTVAIEDQRSTSQ